MHCTNVISPHPARFQEVPHRSAEYWQAVELRQRILREPLGQTLTVAELLAETPPQLHYSLRSAEGSLLACASVIPQSLTLAKVRQVAVLPTHQSSGLGRFLMESLERELHHRHGIQILHLHARALVQGFYEKLGYTVLGEPFEEIGLEHVLMEKSFT